MASSLRSIPSQESGSQMERGSYTGPSSTEAEPSDERQRLPRIPHKRCFSEADTEPNAGPQPGPDVKRDARSATASVAPSKWTCDTCQRSFASRSTLCIHYRMHTGSAGAQPALSPSHPGIA